MKIAIALFFGALMQIGSVAFAQGQGSPVTQYPQIQFGVSFVSVEKVCLNTAGDFQAMVTVCVSEGAQGTCNKQGTVLATTSTSHKICVSGNTAGCTQWENVMYPMEYSYYDHSAKMNKTFVIPACK